MIAPLVPEPSAQQQIEYVNADDYFRELRMQQNEATQHEESNAPVMPDPQQTMAPNANQMTGYPCQAAVAPQVDRMYAGSPAPTTQPAAQPTAPSAAPMCSHPGQAAAAPQVDPMYAGSPAYTTQPAAQHTGPSVAPIGSHPSQEASAPQVDSMYAGAPAPGSQKPWTPGAVPPGWNPYQTAGQPMGADSRWADPQHAGSPAPTDQPAAQPVPGPQQAWAPGAVPPGGNPYQMAGQPMGTDSRWAYPQFIGSPAPTTPPSSGPQQAWTPNMTPPNGMDSSAAYQPSTETEQENPLDFLSKSEKKTAPGIRKTQDAAKTPEKRSLFKKKANKDGYYDDRLPIDAGADIDVGKHTQWVPFILGILGIVAFTVIVIQFKQMMG